MIDVFTEEIEVLIKRGITNLYWFLGDLEKAWYRAGVEQARVIKLFAQRHPDGSKYTKRELMDCLYAELRNDNYNRRLEISRNFVRFLVEHKNFVPQDERHKIDLAETCALKLKGIIEDQRKQAEYNQNIKYRASQAKQTDYQGELLKLRAEFVSIEGLPAQQRGYALEKLFPDLMRISTIPVEESFKLTGEQIDGAIKYDGHYYLVELKWTKKVAAHEEVSSLYLKVEGKLEARGLFISMNGFSQDILQSLPKGKEIRLIFLDGVHFANVIFGMYSFQELLEHALSQASLKADFYCSHDLRK